MTPASAVTSAPLTPRAVLGAALLNGTALALALAGMLALGALGGGELFPVRSPRDAALTVAAGFVAGALAGAALQALGPRHRTRGGRFTRWLVTGLQWGALLGLGQVAPAAWARELPWHLLGVTLAYVSFVAFGTWLHGPFDEDDPPSAAA